MRFHEHLLTSRIPRKLSFTGSVPIGIHLQKLAADTMKRCTMELGGHSPVLVFEDADIEKTAQGRGGRKIPQCRAGVRFADPFLRARDPRSIEFADVFCETAKSVKVGSCHRRRCDAMGPLIGERRLCGMMQQFVDDATGPWCAELMTGGARRGNQGWFYEPTVLKNVPDDAMIMNEEPFGPVAPIAGFKDLDDAMAKANKLDFGLAAYAFTQNPSRIAALQSGINAGLVGINSFMISTPETPFGGVNDSGYGSEGGIEGLDAYLRTKFVTETV